MTRVTLYSHPKDGYIAFAVEGHAQRAELVSQDAYDLVCAAISAVTQVAILGLIQVAGVQPHIAVEEERGYLRMELPRSLDVDARRAAQIILRTMVVGLTNMQPDYEQYLAIQTVEVE
nr:ribosomal-processing cysteine protease Prp [Maliibacterium massiliense]